jgi:UDP-N-acetylmuramoyl-L-alanyl-D-glutamate--2,6-diaminopimelate ligase
MGTINYRWPGHEESAPLTTPDCLTLHENLAQMREAGVEVVVMEVSSHALDQERVAGINFNGAIFTNLSQDHLDYHADMDDYFESKAKLFKAPYGRSQVAAINADCAYGRKLLGRHKRALGFGLTPPEDKRAYVHGEILSLSQQGLHLRMSYKKEKWELESKLVGAFNASNLLAVQALALGLGYRPEQFKALEKFNGVPGRLERIDNPQGLGIFVDYSHTPDALINAQRTLKEAGFKRLITVFGCGGNRDSSKRAPMGKAVAEFADIAVLTSDNPRWEDPLAILDDIRPGLAECPQVVEEIDRRRAIAGAIALMRPGDALLVAGKGHEDYQIIGDVKFPFSDQAVIREILRCN